MNELIKAQLRLCKKAKVPDFNEDDTTIFIPKGINLIPEELQEGGYYIIQLENYIVNPPEEFTLHVNWNNGVIPKSNIMQCVVEKKMGKMIKINGIGYDRVNRCYIESTEWSGWVPQKSITIIKKIG